MPDQWEINPSLSGNVAQGGVADAAGGSTYSGASTGETAGDVAFGGPTSDLILYGVVNGAFAQGPADPASNLDPINNPLPYWSGPTQVGGAATCQWVVDAGSSSGYNLRVTMSPGVAGDNVYFEQTVPLGGSRWRWSGLNIRATVLRVTASDNGFTSTFTGEYLDAAGVATGTGSFSTVPTWTADGQLKAVNAFPTGSPPATSAYVRIRLYISRDTAAASASGTFDITDIRATHAVDRLLIGDTDGTGTYAPAHIYQSGGAMTIEPQGNGVGLGAISIPGGQVKFPATDNPSADANTLDDYEEGAFTPSITFATVGNLNVVYSTQVGTYTKIGRLVNLRIQIATSTFTHTTAAGEFRITGLPFTPVSTFFNQLLMNGWTKANYTYTCGDCQAGITYVRVLASGSGQAVAVFAVGDLPTGGTINIRLGGFFYV